MRQDKPPAPPLLLFSWTADEPYGTEAHPGTIHREGDDDKVKVTFTDPTGKKINVEIPRTNKENGDDKTTIFAYNAKSAEGGDDFGKFPTGEAKQFVYRKIFVIVGTEETRCKVWRFVQLKQATVTLKRPGFPERQLFPAPGQDPDAWSLDLPDDAPSPPEFPPMKGFAGLAKGNGMLDDPGYINPWQDFENPGKPFPKGTVIKASYKFRTFILCCQPPPRGVLGCFTWGFTQEITMSGGKSAKQTITPDDCKWHPGNPPDADFTQAQKDLNRIVNEKAFPAFCK